MNKPLARRLMVNMWLLSASICLITLGLTTYLIFRNGEEQAKNRIKSEEANLIALGVIDLISLNVFQDIVPRLSNTLQSERLNEVIRVYTPPGKLLYTNIRARDFDRASKSRFKYRDKDFYIIGGGTRQYLALTQSYESIDGDTFWIEIATPRQSVTSILRGIYAPFLMTFAIFLIISFFISKHLTQRMLHPLDAIAKQIENLEVKKFKSWEPMTIADRPAEFQGVVRKVNEFLGRIQASFLEAQHLSQYVMHEIRTPLTVMRGEIENALMESNQREGVLQSALEEVDKMDEIVSTLIQLSKHERKAKTYAPESVNIDHLLSSMSTHWETLAKRSVEIRSNGMGPRYAFVDPELMVLLISNLFRNVAAHTPPNSKTVLDIRNVGSDQFLIQVSDRGPGLPDPILQEVNSESPTSENLGIGLTLCKEIALVSQVGLQFQNRPEGGLNVEITFPLAPSP